MAGYNGFSKSNNAVEAEECGRYPLTKASTVLARKIKVTQKQARAMLEEMGTYEYHHTSSRYNTTYYYDVNSTVEKFNNGELVIPALEKQTQTLNKTEIGSVFYIEWGGTRKHPTPSPYTIQAHLEWKEGAVMVSIVPQDGSQPFKKKAENIKFNDETCHDFILERIAIKAS